ncbi:MAG: DUF4347 domain-containing protein [Cyanobacteria bacterium P01_G01_bin.39]
MSTNNLELSNLSQDLFNTASTPLSNNNYDLAAEFTLNNQAVDSTEQLLFIDSKIAEYQTLIDNLTELTEVIILDEQRDGIEQITESLQQYDDLAAVHIASHGSVGQLSLGNSKLNQDNLNSYQDSVTNWADALIETGDILLYGCNVAADPTGTEFIDSLSQYTQADILASTDLTGSADLNGDWDLEYATGEIDAQLAWSAENNQNYQHVLNDFLPGTDIPLFDNGTVFRSLPADVTLPGSANAPIRVEINKFFDAPNISIGRPVVELPVTFDHSIMGNSDFRIDYTPLDLSMIDSEIDPDAPLVNFSQAENQPFTLNFTNGNFGFKPRDDYDYETALFNSLIFPFDASSLNLNANNFEFTSVSLNRIGPVDPDRETITFEFNEGTFDFSSLTSRSSLAFEFTSRVFNVYDITPNNRVQVDENFFFDATAVSFRSDSITFDFRPSTLSFDPSAFAANANLYDYKLSAADFASGVNLTQFNASDYRALDYAFPDDELFNSQYYTGTQVALDTINPFTDYIENGWRAGRNPNGLFNVNYYLSQNPDVNQHGLDPLTHYALFGETEIFDNRDPNRLFDTSYYLAKNSDVADAGANPLLHFIQSGWKESRFDNPGGFNPNRDPSPFFDTSFYFDNNPDVRQVSYELDSANALQHFLEFGPNGSVASEVRIAHPTLVSENQIAFTTFINAESESFEFVKNEINSNDYGIQVSQGSNGEILVASSVTGISRAVQGFFYLAFGAVSYLLSEEFRTTFFEGLQYSNFGIIQGDVGGISIGTEPFPEPTEGNITITTFPKDVDPESIIDPGNENIFFTPLDPIEEISSPNVFPQRDEILDTLLDEPLIFPGTEEIPAGNYAYPSSNNGTWYQGFLNGENENIVISSPTLSDSVREQNIRNELAVNPALNSRTRGKYRGTRGNIGFADYNFGGKTGTIKAFAGNNDAFVNGVPVMLDGFAPFVPADERELETTFVNGFNRAVDSEAKILEEILVNVYEPGDTGTIRLVSTNPICNSCGPVIENFVKSVQATGGEITVEVIQIRLPL